MVSAKKKGGINYWLDQTDRKVKKYLSELPISFLIVHGNHEERASKIGSYKERKWQGGIAIGGAYSVDKDFRVSAGLPWFESEQPSAKIKAHVEEQLKDHDWTVDYVLSHTCPLSMEPTELFLNFIDQSEVDKTTEGKNICQKLLL